MGEMKTETLNPIKSLALLGLEWNLIWRASVSCNFAFCCFYNLVSIVENEQGVYELSEISSLPCVGKFIAKKLRIEIVPL